MLTLGICLWNYAVAYNTDKAVVTESRENRVARSEEFVQTYKDKLCSTNFKLCVKRRFQYLVPMWTNQLISLCVHCTEQPLVW